MNGAMTFFDGSTDMKTFLSYATEDKVWGGYARMTLQALGMSPFLAHDDIEVSAEWQERIKQELSDSPIFVPILSSAFKASNWCSQETGWVASRQGVVVIPLSIDGTTSYGFISHIQSRRMKSSEDVDTTLAEVLLRRFPRIVIPHVIIRVQRARSFNAAETYMRPLLPHFASFELSDATSLAQAAIDNGQVWNAGDCRTQYLPQFLHLNRDRIPPDQFDALAAKIEYDDKS
jgi:hypothetical protein